MVTLIFANAAEAAALSVENLLNPTALELHTHAVADALTSTRRLL